MRTKYIGFNDSGDISATFSCGRDQGCTLPFIRFVPDIESEKFFIDLRKMRDAIRDDSLDPEYELDVANVSIEVLCYDPTGEQHGASFTNGVQANDADGNPYAVIEGLGSVNGGFNDLCLMFAFIASVEGGGIHLFQTEFMSQSSRGCTGDGVLIEACYPNPKAFEMARDVNDDYYGYRFDSGDMSGDEGLRYNHRLWLRKIEVFQKKASLQISYFNKQKAFKTTARKEKVFSVAEFLPAYMMEELFAIMAMGEFYITNYSSGDGVRKKYRVAESLDWDTVSEDLKMYKCETILIEEAVSPYNCDPAPCEDVPPPTCEGIEITPIDYNTLAEMGVPYSEVVATVTGTPPFVFNISTKRPWMNFSIVGGDLIMSGTPPLAVVSTVYLTLAPNFIIFQDESLTNMFAVGDSVEIEGGDAGSYEILSKEVTNFLGSPALILTVDGDLSGSDAEERTAINDNNVGVAGAAFTVTNCSGQSDDLDPSVMVVPPSNFTLQNFNEESLIVVQINNVPGVDIGDDPTGEIESGDTFVGTHEGGTFSPCLQVSGDPVGSLRARLFVDGVFVDCVDIESGAAVYCFNEISVTSLNQISIVVQSAACGGVARVTNTVIGMEITNVTGIPGFGFDTGDPVGSGEAQEGAHDGNAGSSVVPVSYSGAPGFPFSYPLNITVSVNGSVVDCETVTSSPGTKFMNLPPYTNLQEVRVAFNSGACPP